MRYLGLISSLLLIAGGFNWFLVAFAGINIVEVIFGGFGLSKAVYGLVGLAAVWEAYGLRKYF